jgi:hypothetical protein
MAEIGQYYRVKPSFSKVKDGLGQPMVGKVIYIHPQGRYAVLEFPGPNGVAREAFDLEELTENSRVSSKKARLMGK